MQMLKNQLNMQDVFLQIDRVHHEVIHVDDEPSFGEVVCKDMVHECLEGRWRIALAEEHHHRFIEPIKSSESGLPLIGLLNLNVVIFPPNVQFGEVLGVFQSIDEVGDTREGVSIFDGMGVDVVIVLAGTEHAVFPQDKEEEGCLWGLGGDDLSFLEVFINECL